MKNIIITGVIATTALVSPALAMSISPTREALLGLTPDEKILEIADQLDTSKEETKKEMERLQNVIEEQKTTISAMENSVNSLEEQRRMEEEKKNAPDTTLSGDDVYTDEDKERERKLKEELEAKIDREETMKLPDPNVKPLEPNFD